MIQSIINGCIGAIRTKYDMSYRIYTESIEQGLIEPCFSILCLSPLTNREIGQRHMRTFPLMITYFPCGDEPKKECNMVCEELFGLLGSISTDIGIFHSMQMSGEVVDGNLQFKVEFKVPAMLVEEQGEPMEEITVNSSVM